jgi:hypothetical protein
MGLENIYVIRDNVGSTDHCSDPHSISQSKKKKIKQQQKIQSKRLRETRNKKQSNQYFQD